MQQQSKTIFGSTSTRHNFGVDKSILESKAIGRAARAMNGRSTNSTGPDFITRVGQTVSRIQSAASVLEAGGRTVVVAASRSCYGDRGDRCTWARCGGRR